jgi:UDP-N-acetylmuramyl pentapeptide phosphotransferase/UDP-N-acetylglucosamine-1-phosphate transferase
MAISTFILAFLTAFAVTYYVIPSIIRIATEKGLTDEPGERRSHTISTPSLGGIGIFAGTLFSVIAWIPYQLFGGLQYILCSCIVIFLIGVKDDIIPSRPAKKLGGQIFAAFILVYAADVRLTSLYGIFGITELSLVASYFLSIFTIIVIINAFNLIDGVNGLTGVISIVAATGFGAWFFLADHPEYSILASALIGSTVAFLKYNWTPAKIFMGDTGSLLLGLLMSVLTLKFIEFHLEVAPDQFFYMPAGPAAAIGALIVPLFDTLRVFITRLARGRSPLQPDRNHIHHLLIDLGLNHVQTTLVLGTIAVLFIGLAVALQSLGNMVSVLMMIGLAVLGTAALSIQVKRRNEALERKREQALQPPKRENVTA